MKMRTTKKAIEEMTMTEFKDYVVEYTTYSFSLTHEQFSFLFDFNFDNFDGVELVAQGFGGGFLIGKGGEALKNFAEALDNEEIMMHEYPLVRGLVDTIRNRVG